MRKETVAGNFNNECIWGGRGVRRSPVTHPEHKEKNKFPVSVTRGPEDGVKKHLTLAGDPIPSKADVKQPGYNYRDSDVHRSI